MKRVTWLFLLGLAIFNTFNWWNAKVDKYSLMLVGLAVLLSISSDLKEFNLWGFSGKKYEKLLDEVKNDDPALPPYNDGSRPKPSEVEAAQSQEIHLMDSATGNFLSLAFEIERLLRVYATTNLVREVPASVSIKKLTDELFKQNLLTEKGKKQVEVITWLRNLIVHGRQSEVNDETINQGVQVAVDLYNELHSTLYPPRA